MSDKLIKKKIGTQTAYCRSGGDERILEEVLTRGCYSRKRLGFDVLPGEKWLDLGANIGAFALYCGKKGANTVCYEPNVDCFEILQLNAPKCELHNAAVTSSHERKLVFYTSNQADNHSRGTVFAVRGYHVEEVNNIYAGTLKSKKFDGVKMDIEGSEGAILDQWLLPKLSKLCLEYHTSRDSSVANLASRIGMLQRKFLNVQYPPEYDRAMRSGLPHFKTHFDRMIFAWGPR